MCVAYFSGRARTGFIGSEYRQVAGSCSFRDEPSDAIKRGEFLDQLISDFSLPWRNSLQWTRAPSFSRLHDYTQLDTPHLVVIGPTQRTLPDNTQHSQQTSIHDPGEIRAHNPSKRAATYPRLRPRGHWEWQLVSEQLPKNTYFAQ